MLNFFVGFGEIINLLFLETDEENRKTVKSGFVYYNIQKYLMVQKSYQILGKSSTVISRWVNSQIIASE